MRERTFHNWRLTIPMLGLLAPSLLAGQAQNASILMRKSVDPCIVATATAILAAIAPAIQQTLPLSTDTADVHITVSNPAFGPSGCPTSTVSMNVDVGWRGTHPGVGGHVPSGATKLPVQLFLAVQLAYMGTRVDQTVRTGNLQSARLCVSRVSGPNPRQIDLTLPWLTAGWVTHWLNTALSAHVCADFAAPVKAYLTAGHTL